MHHSRRVFTVSPVESMNLEGQKQVFATCAAFILVAHRLFRFKRWNDELRELPRFLVVLLLAVLELGTENWFVWCVISKLLVCRRAHPRKYISISLYHSSSSFSPPFLFFGLAGRQAACAWHTGNVGINETLHDVCSTQAAVALFHQRFCCEHW
jgi:hypothetical protein